MLPNFSGTPAVQLETGADPYTQTRLAAQQGNNMQQIAEGKKLENEKLKQDAQLAEQKLSTAKNIFGKGGVNEGTINQYGQITGDIEGAQKYMEKWRADQKAQQDIVGLRDTHAKTINELVKTRQDIAKAQQEYDNKSYEQFANIAAGIDLNDPASVAAHRALLEAAADEVKSIEINPETGEVSYGPPMQIPEVITPEWKQSIIDRATSLAARETNRHNIALENKVEDIDLDTEKYRRRKNIDQGIKDEEKEEKIRLEREQAERNKAATFELIGELKVSKNLATGWNPKRLLAALPGTAEYATGQKVQQLINLMSVENRSKMKGSGAISDYESKMLAKSSTILSTSLSKKDFIKELNKVEKILKGQMPPPPGSGVGAGGSTLKAGETFVHPNGVKITRVE
jgi:hypothetical protein